MVVPAKRMNLTYINFNFGFLRCAGFAPNQKKRKVVVGALKSDFNLILRDGRCTVKLCAFVPLCLCAFVPLCLCFIPQDQNKSARTHAATCLMQGMVHAACFHHQSKQQMLQWCG